MGESDTSQFESRFLAVELQVRNMDKELFGNGQPGVIKDLMNKISDLEKQVIKIMAIGTTVWITLTGGHILVEKLWK